MKMSSTDALARLKSLDLAGAEPAQNALSGEDARQTNQIPAAGAPAEEAAQPKRKRRAGQKLPQGAKREDASTGSARRRSHSKGSNAAVVTGYLDPVHVEVLLDLRTRFGAQSLSVPSANRLLKVALRLVKNLRPSDAQVLAAFEAENAE